KIVQGSGPTPYNSLTSSLVSCGTGKVKSNSSINCSIFNLLLSKFTATISTPFSCYSGYSFSIKGISSRHGGHQVPQKLSMTPYPSNSLNFIVSASLLLFTLVSSKFVVLSPTS